MPVPREIQSRFESPRVELPKKSRTASIRGAVVTMSTRSPTLSSVCGVASDSTSSRRSRATSVPKRSRRDSVPRRRSARARAVTMTMEVCSGFITCAGSASVRRPKACTAASMFFSVPSRTTSSPGSIRSAEPAIRATPPWRSATTRTSPSEIPGISRTARAEVAAAAVKRSLPSVTGAGSRGELLHGRAASRVIAMMVPTTPTR